MLTAYQVETVAYVADGGFYHPDCAREKYSSLTVEKADAGLANGADLSPLIRYELDEYAGSSAWEYLAQELDEDDPTFEQRAADLADHWVTCDRCGKSIS